MAKVTRVDNELAVVTVCDQAGKISLRQLCAALLCSPQHTSAEHPHPVARSLHLFSRYLTVKDVRPVCCADTRAGSWRGQKVRKGERPLELSAGCSKVCDGFNRCFTNSSTRTAKIVFGTGQGVPVKCVHVSGLTLLFVYQGAMELRQERHRVRMMQRSFVRIL